MILIDWLLARSFVRVGVNFPLVFIVIKRIRSSNVIALSKRYRREGVKPSCWHCWHSDPETVQLACTSTHKHTHPLVVPSRGCFPTRLVYTVTHASVSIDTDQIPKILRQPVSAHSEQRRLLLARDFPIVRSSVCLSHDDLPDPPDSLLSLTLHSRLFVLPEWKTNVIF